MQKKNFASVGYIALGLFLITFVLTSIITKQNINENKESSSTSETISFNKQLQIKKDIKISHNGFENISVSEDFLEQFDYYLSKTTPIDKMEIENPYIGTSGDLQFETDFKSIKISKNLEKEYYTLPKNDLKNMCDNEIYTSIETAKNYDEIDSVNAYYKGKEKEIPHLKIKEFTQKIKPIKRLKQYEVDKIMESSTALFDMEEKINDKSITLKLIGKNTLGIFYNEYNSYYEINEDLYNYLCTIFYVSKEAEESIEFAWVQSIKARDVVNNIQETLDKVDSQTLINDFLKLNPQITNFSDHKYEVQRYILTLEGSGKTETVLVYENCVKYGDKYYGIENADIIVDSMLVDF